MKALLAALAAVCVLAASPLMAGESNWMFRPGAYSNHPATGERINQFEPLPTLAALPDTRPISSGYRRSLVSQRGPDGSSTQYYRVDNFSGGQGGLDAEWERVNDVWQRSVMAGGWASGNTNGNPGWGGGPGWGGPGWGGPGGGGPGWNGPGWNAPGWGGPGQNAPGWNGPGWNGGGPGWNGGQGWNGGPGNGFPPQNWQGGGANNGPRRNDGWHTNQFNLQQQGPDWRGQQVQ